MTLYPDVQAKAQAEITAYLKQRLIDDPSSSRFLMPEDRSKLPYTGALVRELLRWHPVANIIPHQSGSEDDTIISEGKTYRIPADTLVIVNSCNTLANFNTTKAKDENGWEVIPEERYTNDIISHPLPFLCRITPRDGCKEWLREESE
ncbi:hypothetical protein FRC09_009780 [Ceratobasidium sp. 395]|nr:hypothetical protein FRC09_009780 [Ceratobasidium sp. 395]